MRINTPRRYRGAQRRSVFPFGRFILLLLLVVVIGVGIGVYQFRDFFREDAERIVNSIAQGIENNVGTLGAPTATATTNPANNLVSADNAWAVGSASEALRQYLPILGSVPNDVNVYYRATLATLAMGRVREGLVLAEQTVTANPYSSDAWAIRAWALINDGQAGSAIASALHALELDPDNVRARVQLASAYFANGQTERALTTVNEAITLDPDSYEAYWIRGRIREDGLYEFAGALQDYQTAYDIALVSQPVLAGTIAVDIAQQLALRNQDYLGAIEVLKKVLETNPENALALFWMGTIYFSYQGDPSQAAGYLQKCVDENPDSYNCYYLLGRTQFSLEQFSGAQESFSRTVELGSPFARHYWWAANAYFSQGNCEGARTYLVDGMTKVDSTTPQDLRDAYDYLMSVCNISARQPIAPTPTLDPANDA